MNLQEGILLYNQSVAQQIFLPTRPQGQLLKWVGNKYNYAHIITSYFPAAYNNYIEPFVGTGAILATLAPEKGIAGDILTPLIEIWKLLQDQPQVLIDYYTSVISQFNQDRQTTYLKILESFNASPNGLDLLILSRTCYGGVVRFTKEGTMSTPIGPLNLSLPKPLPQELRNGGSESKTLAF